MALIRCPNCQHEISDTTRKCIHCGTKLGKNKKCLKNKLFIKIIIPLLIVVLVLLAILLAIFLLPRDEVTLSPIETVPDNNFEQEEVQNNNTYDNVEDSTLNDDADNESIENDNVNINNNGNDNNSSNSNNTSNNNANQNTTNNEQNNSESNQNSTYIKEIIDATKNVSCPSGYTYQDGFVNRDNPCKKTDIKEGTLIYACPSAMKLIGDKCEYTFTSKPYNGVCYGTGYILNGDVCEKTELFNAFIDGVQCPSGYSKYVINKEDTRCYKNEYAEPNISYTCPDDYILNGTKCEK